MIIHEQFATVVAVKTATVIAIFASGIAVFAALWVWAFKLVTRKMSGWSEILIRFPMVEIHPLGKDYKRQSGDIGRTYYDRGFTLRLAHEGLCVYPFFARHAPCMIPWDSIQNVDVSDRCIFLVVQHELPMQFHLPADALPEVRAYVSPESIRKAVSVFETMKSAIHSSTKPRWLWGKEK